MEIGRFSSTLLIKINRPPKRLFSRHLKELVQLRMYKIAFTIIISFLAFSSFSAQTKAPRFENYKTVSVYNGKSARVNLRSHKEARRFRTALRSIATGGANFAGHYAIGYWGCGTQCLRIGVVDLKTGRAFVAPFYTAFGISYRKDSNLLIVEPSESTEDWKIDGKLPEAYKPRYYLWKNNRLRLIYPKNSKSENYWQ